LKEPKPTSWIQKIPPYVPGISKDSITGRYGIANPIKLASNENALGASPKAIEAMRDVAMRMHLYPDPEAVGLRKAAAAFFQCKPEQVIAGNGSDEIIDLLCRAYLEPSDEVIIPDCTFSYYRIASLVCGADIISSSMRDNTIEIDDILRKVSRKTKIIFIANPNNPTGTCLGRNDIMKLVSGVPKETLLVIDEAYAAFVRQKDFMSAVDLINEHGNIAAVYTLSKSHGLAGVRIGFCVAAESIIGTLNHIKPPFNMNILALKAGEAALKDDGFLARTLKTTWQGLDYLYEQIQRLGLSYVPTQTNFVLVRIGDRCKEIYESLLKQGIITRSMASFGLDEYLRVTVGLPTENEAFIKALSGLL